MTQNAPEDFNASPALRRATGFDPAWFRARYGALIPNAPDDPQALEKLYFEGLARHGWSPNPFVDFRGAAPAVPDRSGLADAARAQLTGSDRPHWLFDRAFYLEKNGDVAEAVARSDLTPYRHFIANGAAEGRRSHPLYCPTTVRELAGDAANPLEAFLTEHETAGASSSPLFDPAYYATMNPDAAIAVREGRYSSLLAHFCTVGIEEDRPFSPYFDYAFYTKENPEAKKAVKAGEAPSVVWHYLYVGKAAWRAPNPYFDTDYYCRENQWVGEDMARLSISDPFEHYLAVGQKMRLRPARPRLRTIAVCGHRRPRSTRPRHRDEVIRPNGRCRRLRPVAVGGMTSRWTTRTRPRRPPARCPPTTTASCCSSCSPSMRPPTTPRPPTWRSSTASSAGIRTASARPIPRDTSPRRPSCSTPRAGC